MTNSVFIVKVICMQSAWIQTFLDFWPQKGIEFPFLQMLKNNWPTDVLCQLLYTVLFDFIMLFSYSFKKLLNLFCCMLNNILVWIRPVNLWHSFQNVWQSFSTCCLLFSHYHMFLCVSSYAAAWPCQCTSPHLSVHLCNSTISDKSQLLSRCGYIPVQWHCGVCVCHSSLLGPMWPCWLW